MLRRAHLEAALAIWKYSYESCEFIFGRSLGDQVADEILSALCDDPDGLTRKQIRDLFARHAPVRAIERALRTLASLGLARSEQIQTAGRAAQRWFAIASATNAT
jgi:hypothetical protein